MASPISNTTNTTPSPTGSQSNRSNKLDSSNGNNVQPDAQATHNNHDSVNLSHTGLNLHAKSTANGSNNIEVNTPEEAADLAANIGRFIRENAAQALQAQTGNFDSDFIKLLK